MTSWVPQSCTLPTEQRPLRAAEFDALFAQHLIGVSRPGPLALHLLLTSGPGVEEQVRDLAARESGCCSFFTFTVSAELERLRLGVEVDAAHAAVLDALQVRRRGPRWAWHDERAGPA